MSAFVKVVAGGQVNFIAHWFVEQRCVDDIHLKGAGCFNADSLHRSGGWQDCLRWCWYWCRCLSGFLSRLNRDTQKWSWLNLAAPGDKQGIKEKKGSKTLEKLRHWAKSFDIHLTGKPVGIILV